MENLIKKYIEWLNNKMSFRQLGECYEITTPFLNHHNDYIQVFATKDNGKIILSDDGVTLEELEMSGVQIDRSEKRKDELNIILNSFGIKRNTNNELFITCDEKNFPESKHRLLQALINIYDLYILAEPKIENFFLEDVMNLFDKNDIRYTPNVQFMGRSNFPHHFDFSIPKTKVYPERIVKLLNTPRKDLLFSLLFSFEDTQKNRPDSRGFVVLNDKEKKVSSDLIDALNEYQIQSILWSDIYQKIDLFKN